MNELFVVSDIVILAICIIGFYIAFRLWSLLGKQGITSWFMLAFLYAIVLRSLSLCVDLKLMPGLFELTKALALPLYLLLVLGLWGLHWQVRVKLLGQENKFHKIINWLINKNSK